MHPLDALAMAHHANGASIARFMSELFPCPYTLRDAYRWIMTSLAADTQHNFAICLPGECAPDTSPVPDSPGSVIGGIGLKPGVDVQRRTMEVGYWVGEAHAGKGIATASLEAFTTWTFETFPDVVKLVANVFEGHEASLRVLGKAGYKREAVLRWHVCKNGVVGDLHVLRMCRDEWEVLKMGGEKGVM